MRKVTSELEKIKGIGTVLAKRLADAGHDTVAKVAEAGEEGLRKIKGLNPRAIPSILDQAAGMTQAKGDGRARRIEELKAAATTIREQVEGIARNVRDRFTEELQDKDGRKIEKEVLKMVAALERVEGKLGKRVKRAGKGLAKAEKRLAGLADAGLKGVGKGLRRARKSLKRVLS